MEAGRSQINHYIYVYVSILFCIHDYTLPHFLPLNYCFDINANADQEISQYRVNSILNKFFPGFSKMIVFI